MFVIGFGTLRVVWVFDPDEVSPNTGGEELLVAKAERRVAVRTGVRGDISGLGTGFTSTGGGVLLAEGMGGWRWRLCDVCHGRWEDFGVGVLPLDVDVNVEGLWSVVAIGTIHDEERCL